MREFEQVETLIRIQEGRQSFHVSVVLNMVIENPYSFFSVYTIPSALHISDYPTRLIRSPQGCRPVLILRTEQSQTSRKKIPDSHRYRRYLSPVVRSQFQRECLLLEVKKFQYIDFVEYGSGKNYVVNMGLSFTS